MERNPLATFGHVTLQQIADGEIAIRFVLDTALSPDHTANDIHENAIIVGIAPREDVDHPVYIAVIAATQDTEGVRDEVPADEGEDVAIDYVNEITPVGDRENYRHVATMRVSGVR
jgi:hypothetical protein